MTRRLVACEPDLPGLTVNMLAPMLASSKGLAVEDPYTEACARRVMARLILLRHAYSRSALRLR